MDAWQDYAVAFDRTGAKPIVTLSAKSPSPRQHGTLMQVISAERWRGKRIRFSGYLRPASVGNRAGLWMRVDGKEFEKALAWDNMSNRPIRGTTDWVRAEVVLQIPLAGERIYFGVSLEGAGAVAAKELRWEVVDASVPVTDQIARLPDEPQNLDLAP
jgi:hypothetical protein